ncbi:hypothetical protein Pan153_19530 [Gimesia panareensis]|uniref:Uncharacterized protein n=1 Tax=Gimesia panareensis TaxID=2527978 RepID=A0A518FLT2_9PLAN|nr:hypothetical protein [Gimesia panareensis]QDV17318.1 hypothetical protein Pan153_19530 [Gimesia panareensis]
MKNVYYPDQEDILEWANGPGQSWPESDWDYHVIDSRNDELIFSLVCQAHQKSGFFLHCLYCLAGIILLPDQDQIPDWERLDKLLIQVTERSRPELIEWKSRVDEVRHGKKAYVAEEWYNADIEY